MITRETTLDTLCVNVIRGLAMDGPQKADSGHPGTAMALAPLGWTLFSRVMRHNPHNPAWPDRDRFILSCGHACILQYSLLHLTGYGVSLDDLKNFRQWESITPGHPEHFMTPGVETTTGPLGQGLSNGVGMALAERYLAARFNKPGHEIVDHHTYVFCSDGDIMEGVSQEACSLAGHLGLGKLICVYDDNHITIGGTTEISFTEDRDARFRAYGWHVQRLEDPNDLDAFEKAVLEAKKDPRPSLISVRTIIAWPAPKMQNTPESHGSPLGDQEIQATKTILGMPADQTFYVPDEAREHGLRVVERGHEVEDEWNRRFEAYRKEFPELAAEFEDWLDGRLPSGWDKDLPKFEAGKAVATRNSSGKVINALAPRLPNLIGGSADLEPSTKTLIDGSAVNDQDHPEGRNIHFGVREHGMGAILNGMITHGGVIPYGATFLVFSDYMRGSVRLAALMGVRVIYVWTHDSIGLGEDGPTHQPIEQLAALRAIPNMTILRPADANEVTEAWKAAIRHEDGPVGLVLTRQNVPTFDRTKMGPAQDLHKGAYVLVDAEGGEPKVVLIGTGSEVHLCVEARELLQKEGIPTRVVSMPSWEFFARQEREYRDSVLLPGVPRLAVEAASPFGWCRWVGDRGDVLGIERFGASAPWQTNYEKFGFTPANIAARAKKLL